MDTKIILSKSSQINSNDPENKNIFVKKISNEQISSSTGSSECNEVKIIEQIINDSQNHRFSLRKRRSVNYNSKTKKFEYDDDSDYEDKPKKNAKKKIKKTKIETHKNYKDLKLKTTSNSEDCREFQLSGLLNWKNYDFNEETQIGETEYYEFDDICGINLNKYCQELEAILINPPWSNKAPKFDFCKFSKLKLPLEKMKEGLIFAWTEKEYISDVIYFFENQDIKYVENLVWIVLDPSKKEVSSNTLEPFNLNNIFKVDDYTNFSKCHKTLLIFRKFLPSNKRFLELRHQRTGDAVFDYEDPNIPNYKPFYYIYRLIEILLPKANYKQGESLKMMEIFGRKDHKRKGWINIVQK